VARSGSIAGAGGGVSLPSRISGSVAGGVAYNIGVMAMAKMKERKYQRRKKIMAWQKEKRNISRNS